MDWGNEKEKFKNKVTRVQRLINIKIAKAYRAVSKEALCVVTGMTPIHIKIEEAAELYLHTRSSMKDKEQFDNNPYSTAFPYGNGMVLHFYQQQESSTTETVHKVINKGLKAYV